MKRYENLQVLAEKAKPLFLQYYKKNKKRLGKMDTIVQQLHDEVVKALRSLDSFVDISEADLLHLVRLLHSHDPRQAAPLAKEKTP